MARQMATGRRCHRVAIIIGAAASLHAAQPAFGVVRCTDPWGKAYQLANASSATLLGLSCTEPSAAQAVPAEQGDRRDAAVTPANPVIWPGAGLELVQDRGARFTGLLVLEVRGRSRDVAAQSASALQPLIEEVARSYRHDMRLLHAIIQVESRFNPQAVSPKGAIGLMQLMPATAERMGLRDPTRMLFDPLSNLHAGARYLRLLLDMFPGRTELAIAAYNAGEGAVMKYGRIPPYPETQEYVRSVMRIAGLPAVGPN